MKQSWKDRATELNNCPIPGLLAEFPHVRLPGNLKDMVVKALRSDFTKLSKIMHRYINREPRHDVTIHKVIKFIGPPLFKLRLQTIQHNISISKVVMNYLFGEGYNQYEQNVIKTTPRAVLWPIASTKRVEEIFNIADLCGAQVFDKNNTTI